MPKNSILSNYLSKTYDKEKNLESIHSKIKKHEVDHKKYLNIAAIFILTICISSIGYAMKKRDLFYQEFENRKIGHSNAVNLALENGLEEKIDMEYLYQDDIGIKIDSILLTNDNLKMNVNFKFKNYSNLNTVNMGFCYAIYDENNNIYQIFERYVPKESYKSYKQYKKLLAKELNLRNYFWEELPKELAGSGLTPYCITSKDGNLIFETNIKTMVGFPKTKKLFVRIYNPGYCYADYIYYTNPITKTKVGYPVNVENHKLSNSEWQFEINISDTLYNSEVLNLKFNEDVKEFELEKAEISDTGLLIELNLSKGYSYENNGKEIFKVTNNKGEEIVNSLGRSENNHYSMLYDISKDELDNGIYFHINIPELNLNKVIQLVKK